LAAFLVTGFFLARNLSTWPARISYPGEESYEGLAMAEMIDIRQGVPTYAPSIERYDDATYGPLYYLLAGRLVDLRAPSYVPLRLLSALGIIGCAGGCGLLAFWLSDSYHAALLAPLVFLSYGMVSTQGIQSLSDSVALLLAFWGFLVAYRFQRSGAVLLAVPLMILSFYYKPHYVAGPIAVFCFLVSEKRYRSAAKFAGLLMLSGVALFAFFQWVIFSGQAFWRHFLLTQSSLLSWQRFEKALFVVCVMFLFPLIFEIEYLRTNPNKMISFYLFFGLVVGAVTYSKDGSGVHYFFESMILISILIPVLLFKQITSQGIPIHVVLVLAIMLLAGQWSTKGPPQRVDFDRHNAMQAFLRQNFPPHSEALGASPGDLLQAGLDAPFSGLFTFVQLAHRGILSDRDLAAQIANRRFSAIVLTLDLSHEQDPYWLNFYLTPATREAIEQRYTRMDILDMPTPLKQRPQDRYYVYVPKRND
jgi:hypothetical protein